MKKIVEHIYVGIVEDVPYAKSLNYSILGCCKNPLHRQHARLQGASEDGYVGKAMPSTEREYLYAERDHALYLNLIDARDVKYISDEVINKALEFIDKEIEAGRDVLIACNKGQSRSPSIAFIWLIIKGMFDNFKYGRFDYVMSIFKSMFYESYNPSVGMKEYVKRVWDGYCYDMIGGN